MFLSEFDFLQVQVCGEKYNSEYSLVPSSWCMC